MLTRASRKMMSVFWGADFVGADQQIERVGRFALAEIDFGEQILRFGRIGLQLQRAIQGEFGVSVFAVVDVGLRERKEHIEGVGL